jgi:ABC-type polysaccharide/polyol phosphate transport system ATPase subunit
MWSEARSGVAIRVERVGKRYELGARRQKYRTLREAITTRASRVGQRIRHPASRAVRPDATLWALQDVTLAVPRGRAIGVIGHNGSGKSTLLKILSRVTPPTVGRVEIRGRVGTLLEVGTGFHNELTGRENVYLSGAILGLKRADIERRFDAIVEFAGVSRFIDTPVKWYSSGMYLRLAFAVAAHLEPQILLVDEVLAVGDAAFQRKCLGRMSDVAGEGRTVVLVSHDLDAIERLCPECVLLDHGHIAAYGPTPAVVQQYLSTVSGEMASPGWIDLTQARRSGSGEARFVAGQVSPVEGTVAGALRPGGPFELTFVIESDAARSIGSLAVSVEMLSGTKLIEADIMSLGELVSLEAGTNTVRFRIAELHLNPGVYSVRLWLGTTMKSGFDHLPSAFQIEVVRPAAAAAGALPVTGGAVPCRFEVAQDR